MSNKFNRVLVTYNNKRSNLYLLCNAFFVLLVGFCIIQLSGCNFTGRSFKTYDGPPRIDVDVSKIPNAVPKAEPYHPYGTRDYFIGSKKYRVLRSSKGYVRKGYASWYGTKFHGNHTSTQERYSLYGMTAASTDLPLPSYVEVTNLNNGKKVVLRVNDRGPFYPNRILDVSYVAAKKLGFAEDGVAPVKVVAIDPRAWHKNQDSKSINKIHKLDHTTKTIVASSSIKSRSYNSNDGSKDSLYLQLGVFTKFVNAKNLSNKLVKITNKPPLIDHGIDSYKVQIGPISNTNQCDKIKKLLAENGFKNIVIIRK